MAGPEAGRFNERDYWSSRGYKTSARLHLQHWLFEATIGFTLHPSIQKTISEERPTEVKVADMGCGNGAWLNAVSRQLPAGSTLTGFDINPKLFPAQPFLAPNVSLHTLDVLTGLTDPALLGAFDVVHLRAFTSIIRNNDTAPVLGAAMKLLKPGGFLQWEEARNDKMRAVSPGEGVSKATCDMMLGIIDQGGKASGVSFEFLSSLPSHLEKAGFTAVTQFHFPSHPEHMQAWTEDYLQVWEDITAMLPSAADKPDAPLTKETYLGLLGKCLDETDKGVVLDHQSISMVVGRKAD